MKYEVTVYYEQWEVFEVEATSEEEAREKALTTTAKPLADGSNGVSDVVCLPGDEE